MSSTFSHFLPFSFQRTEGRGSLELNAGEGGEEGRFQAEEAGVAEWWDSETGFPTRLSTTGFQNWKSSETRFEDGRQPTETGLQEQRGEVQPKRARAVPGGEQLEGFSAGRLAH